jgi:PhoPQ-activated pathogenicity-related protein
MSVRSVNALVSNAFVCMSKRATEAAERTVDLAKKHIHDQQNRIARQREWVWRAGSLLALPSLRWRHQVGLVYTDPFRSYGQLLILNAGSTATTVLPLVPVRGGP